MADSALAAGPSGSGRRYVTISVLSNNSDNSTTAPKDSNRSLDSASQYICHTLSSATSDPKQAEWLLDSGASRHFTHDINEFVEYEAIDPVPLRMATNYTWIKGKGTVILLLNQRKVRISPVFHVPEISSQLFSLGQFLSEKPWANDNLASNTTKLKHGINGPRRLLNKLLSDVIRSADYVSNQHQR